MQVAHGIVTDTHVAYYDHIKGCLQWVEHPIQRSQLTSIGAYVDLANRCGLTQLWVLPGTHVSEQYADFDDSFVTQSLEHYNVFPKELESFLTARHKTRPGKEVTLIVPAYIRGLPQSVTHLTDTRAMYAYVTYLQALLGVPFTRDAKGTGIALLYQENDTPERKACTPCTGYIRPVESDLTLFYQHKQEDIRWSRTLLPEERKLQYLHSIDRNFMYLAATSGLHIGAGDYAYTTVSPDQVASKLSAVYSIPFSKKQPGLWLVSLSGDTPFSTGLLPPVFESYTWQDTALVQTAIECGYQVVVHAAYTFPEVHTVFNPWYNTLRKAIEALTSDIQRFRNSAARQAVLETIKMLYRQTIGLMGREPKENEKAKWYNRPDIYNAVVGESKHRMFITIRDLIASGVALVAVNVDEILMVSDKPLDHILSEKIVISSQIGKYKHKATYPLSEVQHLLTGNVHTLAQGLAEYRKEAA